MIETVVETVTSVLGVSGVQTGVLAFLAAVALYSRKALGFGRLLAGWLRTFVVVAVVLVVLLGTGVLKGVDVDAIVTAVRLLLDVLKGPIVDLVAVA